MEFCSHNSQVSRFKTPVVLFCIFSLILKSSLCTTFCTNLQYYSSLVLWIWLSCAYWQQESYLINMQVQQNENTWSLWQNRKSVVGSSDIFLARFQMNHELQMRIVLLIPGYFYISISYLAFLLCCEVNESSYAKPGKLYGTFSRLQAIHVQTMYMKKKARCLVVLIKYRP